MYMCIFKQVFLGTREVITLGVPGEFLRRIDLGAKVRRLRMASEQEKTLGTWWEHKQKSGQLSGLREQGSWLGRDYTAQFERTSPQEQTWFSEAGD